MDLVELEPRLKSSFGIHPTNASEYTDETEEELLNYLKHPSVVAVGEMGLDFYHKNELQSVQEEAFKR